MKIILDPATGAGSGVADPAAVFLWTVKSTKVIWEEALGGASEDGAARIGPAPITIIKPQASGPRARMCCDMRGRIFIAFGDSIRWRKRCIGNCLGFSRWEQRAQALFVRRAHAAFGDEAGDKPGGRHVKPRIGSGRAGRRDLDRGDAA